MFIFGGNTGKSYDQIKREQEIAQALLTRSVSRAPRDIGEGLNAIGMAIAGKVQERRANRAEREGRKQAGEQFDQIVSLLGGGGGAEQASGGAAPAGDVVSSLNAGAGVSDDMWARVIEQESGGNPNAVSPKGAMGPAQVMPDTARDPGYGVPSIFDVARSMGVSVPDESDATLQTLLRNPQVNESLGRQYFNAMLNENGGDARLAAASYNAGPGAVERAGGVPNYAETQQYVANVAPQGQTAMNVPQAAQAAQAGMPQQPDPNRLQMLMAAAGNDFLNQQQRAVVNALLQREIGLTSPEQTSAMREFALAKSQGFQGSFLDYLTAIKRAGASSVTVGGPNVNFEKEYDKARGKANADRVNNLVTAADGARSALSALDSMESMMADPGFYSGVGSEQVLALKRLGRAMGLQVEGIDSMEAFNAQAKGAALDAMGGSLGAGFSNADRDFVTGQVPGLENTPEGNRRLIEIQRKLNERKLQIAEMALEYERRNGRLDSGFDRELQAWAERNQLFPSVGGGAPPEGEKKRMRYNPNTGEIE